MIRRYLLFIALIGFITLKSCDSKRNSNGSIGKFWKKYVKIVGSKDLEALKSISLPKIDCVKCLDNSAEEDSVVINFKLKNPDSWYDKLYGELVYIPLEKFISQDFEILFDSHLLSKMKNTSKINFISRVFEKKEGQEYLAEYLKDEEAPKLYEALITTVDPSTQDEGEQVIIQFLETNQGILFYGFSTIP